MNYFSKRTDRIKHYIGIDISDGMISLAQKANKNAVFLQSNNGIPEKINISFDVVYSIAVLAHIPDESLNSIIESIYFKTETDGIFIAFEQVAPFNYGGKDYTRRTIKTYTRLFEKNNFKIERHILLSYNCHRFFERHIAKRYYKYFCKSKSDSERRHEANTHLIFRLISSLFLFFDFNPIKENVETGWGNSVFILKKQ